jgi:hypothetical protein
MLFVPKRLQAVSQGPRIRLSGILTAHSVTNYLQSWEWLVRGCRIVTGAAAMKETCGYKTKSLAHKPIRRGTGAGKNHQTMIKKKIKTRA